MKTVMRILVGLGALAALVLFLLTRSRAHDTLLSVGAPAPDVVGVDANGATVKLWELRGHPAVVYFYPKDETAGCTKEACAFRDAAGDFAKAGVTIFAVSRDTTASHQEFRDRHHLPFPMVADTSGELQTAYGVPPVLPGTNMAARVTFLVGPDGKIARVWRKVDPLVNAKEVLAAAAALHAKS